jgi:hypothetical protein
MIANTPSTLFERDEMTEEEKQLFLSDLQFVCEEYFEDSDRLSLDVTRTEEGFSVCVIFNSRRIKRFKKPQ